MSEAPFAFKGHRKLPPPPPHLFKHLLRFFFFPIDLLPLPWPYPAGSSTRFRQDKFQPPACSWLSRTGGFQVQLLDLRATGYLVSPGITGTSFQLSHRKPSSHQCCTNTVALKWSGNSHFWEGDYWRNMKYQTERLDKVSSSSVAFVLTQQYLPNHHPCSDFAVCCYCFMCTFNSNNVTFKMNCWDQAEVLSKTASASG